MSGDYDDDQDLPVPVTLDELSSSLLGVKDDLKTLLDLFCNTKSVRYSEFQKIWSEFRMSTIYAGKERANWLRTFTEHLLAYAATLLQTCDTFQRQVFVVYLLYSLYFTQRCKPAERIRVEASTYKLFIELADTAKRDEHLDVAYCAGRLLQQNAFERVAFAVEYFPQCVTVVNAARRRAEVAATTTQRARLGERRMQIVERLATVNEVYEAVKRPHLQSIPDRSVAAAASERDMSFSERLNGLNTRLGVEETESAGHSASTASKRRRRHQIDFT